MNSRSRTLAVGLSVLLLAALACNLPVGQQLAATELVDTLVGGEAPPAASQAPAAPALPASQEPAAPQVPAASEVPAAPAAPVQTYPDNLLKNPGFEEGFNSWSELPDALQYGGQSVDEDVVAHTGEHSRKLFLRYGGSYIIQRVSVDPVLPVGSSVSLNLWYKMPYAGGPTNKCFNLQWVVGNDSGGQETETSADTCAPSPNWTQFGMINANTDIPISWIEVHALTNKGDGNYKNFDKPVYVDDFTLKVLHPP